MLVGDLGVQAWPNMVSKIVRQLVGKQSCEEPCGPGHRHVCSSVFRMEISVLIGVVTVDGLKLCNTEEIVLLSGQGIQEDPRKPGGSSKTTFL